ncbi:hypothetical protein [Legionella gresilensis]|uniref:hypothetical protein n=1 Tax=Legionella gresilensis TaxID=91823 RepID=UPI0010415AD2|nr:hypothetical protein [Legionella gresilensis]
MFKEQTLFILGAGASYPYGFPLGKELINCILQDMNDEVLITTYKNKEGPPAWNNFDLPNYYYELEKVKCNMESIKNTVNRISINDVNPCQGNLFKINNLFYPTNANKKAIYFLRFPLNILPWL